MPSNALVEYDEKIESGDLIQLKKGMMLIQLKKGMMLIEPNGPVQVLKADNEKGIYEVMYMSSNYVVGCGRMDIEGHWN